MLIIHDNGGIEYVARGVVVTLVPANVLTPAERDAMRPPVAKLRAAGRAQVRALLTAAIAEIDQASP